MVHDVSLVLLVGGALLLVAGRRLYWLLVGLVGFVVGFALTARYFDGATWQLLLIGLMVGVLAAWVAVLFQKLALVVAGFLAGVLVIVWWAGQMAWSETVWMWILVAVAGTLGAILVRTVFDLGLVVVSSALGATFVCEALERPPGQASALFAVLMVVGILIQLVSWRQRRSS